MLTGQVISLWDSAIISLTGILIVMLELAFLAVFIQVLSKVLAAVVKDKKASESGTERKLSEAAAILVSGAQEEEDDLAVIMTTVLEETGLSLEQVIFRSVVRIK